MFAICITDQVLVSRIFKKCHRQTCNLIQKRAVRIQWIGTGNSQKKNRKDQSTHEKMINLTSNQITNKIRCHSTPIKSVWQLSGIKDVGKWELSLSVGL